MKRKIACLSLVLFALVSHAEAGAKRPKPSKLDLKVRALMKPHFAEFSYERPGGNNSESDQNSIPLSKKEVTRFADSLYLLPQQSAARIKIGSKGQCLFFWYLSEPSQTKNNVVEKLNISFNIGETGSECVLIYPKRRVKYRLHPATAKRWMELLLANPRISPQLRAMMHSRVNAFPTTG